MKDARMTPADYLKLGWKLVPLHHARPDGTCTCGHTQRPDKSCECGDKKCKVKHGPGSIGKHPRLADWPGKASSDPIDIDEWQQKFPGCNLGIATGGASGIVVIDVDPKNGGDASLKRLIANHGELPATPVQRTPSGGRHILFRAPGFPVSNTPLAPGIDIRGDGGQIVVAPSRTHAGAYSWQRSPWETPLAAAPDWVLAMLRQGPARTSPKTGTVSDTARGYFPPATKAVVEAAQHDLAQHGPAVDGQAGGLHTVQAGMILTRDHALTDDEAWPLLLEWNKTCVPPWEPEELRAKALGNGRKYARGEYGSRRALDVVERARKLIHDWRADAEASAATESERERSMDRMIQACRELVRTSTEPAHRERIQNELIAATGLGALALALPRVRATLEKRAEPSAEQSTWTIYGFELGTNGAPAANIDTAVRVLEHEKRRIFFEEFSQRIYGDDGEWSDADDLTLALDMQRRLGLVKMTPQIVTQAVQAYAHRNARDVVREHFDRLTWDSTERIAGFLSLVYGAPDNEYTRAASANFWKPLAARATKPGCKVDTMLVLEGEQGLRKSSSLRIIAGPELFAEASESPTSKDFFLALQGKLLVEVAEMDSFSRSEVTAVKRVLSCQVDRYRVPYGRASRDFPRRGVFVGTTNRSDWARDDTGARRFWPIRCRRVDVAYIEAERDQLFAEAVARVKAGEPWWEMPAEATEAEQEARRQTHPWEELLSEYLADPNAPTQVTTVELMRRPLGLDVGRMDRAAQMQVASALKRLGFVRVDGWLAGRKQKFWKREGGR